MWEDETRNAGEGLLDQVFVINEPKFAEPILTFPTEVLYFRNWVDPRQKYRYEEATLDHKTTKREWNDEV